MDSVSSILYPSCDSPTTAGRLREAHKKAEDWIDVESLSRAFSLDFADKRVQQYFLGHIYRPGSEFLWNRIVHIVPEEEPIMACSGGSQPWVAVVQAQHMKKLRNPYKLFYQFPPSLPTRIETYLEKQSADTLLLEIRRGIATFKEQAVYEFAPPRRYGLLMRGEWTYPVVTSEVLCWYNSFIASLVAEAEELQVRKKWLYKYCRKIEKRVIDLGYEEPVQSYKVTGHGRYSDDEERTSSYHWVPGPEISSSEVANRIANDLANLEKGTAKVKIETENGRGNAETREYILQMPRYTQISTELAERHYTEAVDRTRALGYSRPRIEVLEEIKQRHAQLREQHDEDSNQPPPKHGNIAAQKGCHQCGAQPDPDALFCAQCGARL